MAVAVAAAAEAGTYLRVEPLPGRPVLLPLPDWVPQL